MENAAVQKKQSGGSPSVVRALWDPFGFMEEMFGWGRSGDGPLFEVKETDIEGSCYRSFDHDKKRDFCERGIDFEHNELFLRDGTKLVKIEKPDDADGGVWDDELLLRLRSDCS